jgi:hypothetical protein
VLQVLRLMGALSLTRRKPRGRSGLHSTPGLASTVLTRRLAPSVVRGLARTVPGAVPRRCTPGFHRSPQWGPHCGWGRSHRRSIHAPLWGSIPRGIRFMINRMTGEPILPARTADQYLATNTHTHSLSLTHTHGRSTALEEGVLQLEEGVLQLEERV